MLRLIRIEPRLSVADVAAAYRFYSEVLGFFSAGRPPGPGDTFASLRREGVGIQLVQADGRHPAGPATVWIEVPDVSAALEALGDRVRIAWGPTSSTPGCVEVAILDPDGNRLVFSASVAT